MTCKIDLHTHSAASDGTDSPCQLLKKAQASGLQILALTDHDTVAGVEELLAIHVSGLSIISGIEFSCRMESGKCHILGYGFDPKAPQFCEALREGSTLRGRKLEQRLDFLRGQGICFPDEEVDGLHQLPSAGKPHIANLMVKYGYAASRRDAIERTLNQCHTGNSRIAAETAVTAIRESGGIPVWAHPLGGEGEAFTAPEQFHKMLDELISYGIMGLECFYSKYFLKDCQGLSEAARKNHLLISGGSDYHGRNKGIVLGTLNRDGQIIVPSQLTVLTALLERRGSL